jgi:hypothetical protein
MSAGTTTADKLGPYHSTGYSAGSETPYFLVLGAIAVAIGAMVLVFTRRSRG